MELELRMYFFVPYNLSPIQQAIQAGHAAQQYDLEFRDNFLLINFIQNYKTWIILNGGTTNNSIDPEIRGTLNNISDEIRAEKINYSVFHEPDLNNALTAICFIADERVFNFKDYPIYRDWVDDKTYDAPANTLSYPPEAIDCDEYMELIGGKKNLFLKELIRGKPLA